MKWSKFRENHILIVLCVALALGGAHPCAANGLQLKIDLDKDTFVLREPVWVDLYFVNQGDQDLTLDCLGLCWQRLTVHLVNSEGDTQQYCGYVADGICRAGPTIRPYEPYRYHVNLSQNFGIGALEYLPPILRYFEHDTYTLQMTYTGVSSNSIRFEVRSPVGEERLAYSLLKDASRSGFKYYDQEAQQVIDIFQELVSKYPQSAYADLAHYELAGLYGLLGKPEKTHEYFRKLILNYPNSRFVLKALPELLRQQPEDQKAEFLRVLIKSQPNTRASDCARKFLEEIEAKQKSDK